MRQIKLKEIEIEKQKKNWKQGEDEKVVDEWAKLRHKEKLMNEKNKNSE